jgi:hypothetical protein
MSHIEGMWPSLIYQVAENTWLIYLDRAFGTASEKRTQEFGF